MYNLVQICRKKEIDDRKRGLWWLVFHVNVLQMLLHSTRLVCMWKMFLVQCCKLCNHKYASNIKGKWSKKTVCLLFVDSFIHACLSVCDCHCHCHCEEGCYIIMVCHSILYMKLVVGFMYHGMSTTLLLSQCKETVPLVDWLLHTYTSQVTSIDWSTLCLVEGSTARRTIGLLHKYGFMCSCPPMRRTVNWLQYVETLSPAPLPDSSL